MAQTLHTPAADALARLTEQSAVRDMRAALAEAGMLDDEYRDRLADRWRLANDAVDRVVLSLETRRELNHEHILNAAARIACGDPLGFVKAVYRHVTRKGE